MGKTNKNISETEKRRDHPVNPTDVERDDAREVQGGRDAGERRDEEAPQKPLISRDPGTLLEH